MGYHGVAQVGRLPGTSRSAMWTSQRSLQVGSKLQDEDRCYKFGKPMGKKYIYIYGKVTGISDMEMA